MTLTGAANCKIGYNLNSKKGETNMWTVFEETWKEGKLEGKAEEIVEIGYEFGLSENDILERLQTKLNISLQKAQEYLAMFGKRVVQKKSITESWQKESGITRKRKEVEQKCVIQ